MRHDHERTSDERRAAPRPPEAGGAEPPGALQLLRLWEEVAADCGYPTVLRDSARPSLAIGSRRPSGRWARIDASGALTVFESNDSRDTPSWCERVDLQAVADTEAILGVLNRLFQGSAASTAGLGAGQFRVRVPQPRVFG